MKFLIDAQLPPSLKNLFISKRFDCLHTLDLDLKNETPDSVINFISINEERVVITKDTDFLKSFLLKKQPYKLILVKLGNTSKNEVINFFQNKFNEIIKRVESESLIFLRQSTSDKV
jgi:predicted nuclease of predicted toxin-antitoxin system